MKHQSAFYRCQKLGQRFLGWAAVCLTIPLHHLSGAAAERLAFTALAADKADVTPFDTWYPWRATGNAEQSVLGMADWLEKTAGRHGRITRDDKRLIYHGQPIVFHLDGSAQAKRHASPAGG